MKKSTLIKKALSGAIAFALVAAFTPMAAYAATDECPRHYNYETGEIGPGPHEWNPVDDSSEKVSVSDKQHKLVEKYMCAQCDQTKEEATYENHNFGSWIKDDYSTIYKEGSKHRVCIGCDYVQTAALAKSRMTATDKKVTTALKSFMSSAKTYNLSGIKKNSNYLTTSTFSGLSSIVKKYNKTNFSYDLQDISYDGKNIAYVEAKVTYPSLKSAFTKVSTEYMKWFKKNCVPVQKKYLKQFKAEDAALEQKVSAQANKYGPNSTQAMKLWTSHYQWEAKALAKYDKKVQKALKTKMEKKFTALVKKYVKPSSVKKKTVSVKIQLDKNSKSWKVNGQCIEGTSGNSKTDILRCDFMSEWNKAAKKAKIDGMFPASAHM